jgi:hypothetical protein
VARDHVGKEEVAGERVGHRRGGRSPARSLSLPFLVEQKLGGREQKEVASRNRCPGKYPICFNDMWVQPSERCVHCSKDVWALYVVQPSLH